MKKKSSRKKILIIIIILLVIILITVLVMGSIFKSKKLDINTPQKEDTKEMVLIDNLDVEINSEINLLSFIKDKNNLEIISTDEKVDTKSLGERELVIKYKNGPQEKDYKFKINIIDTTVPNIEYKKELSTTVGSKIDLLKDVKVTDNSEEEIKATVEGEYDFNKEGTYNLKYVAIDSSNNKKEEEFTLTVTKKEEKKTTTNNKSNTSSNSKESSSKTPPKNANPTKEWVDFDYTEENGQTADYKYGTKVTEVYQYIVFKYSDNTEEKIPIGVSYKLDSSSYNGNTKNILSEATEVANSNVSSQNEMLGYVNEYRAEKGAEPLTIDKDLSIAATVRAIEMAYSGKFSHERPGMSGNDSCFTVLSELNISRSNLGENIAAGNSTVKATAVQWRNSSGHYANMINPNFKKIGIGIFKDNASKNIYYWVQIFSN